MKEDLSDAIGVLLRRAQAVGAVRPDVTPDAVLALVGATCQATAHATAAPALDLLTIVCDGLRVQAAAARRRIALSGRPSRAPVPARMRAVRVGGTVQRQPAVALEHLAGHPPHGVQGDDRLGDVARLAQPAQRRALGHAGQPGRALDGGRGPRPSIGVRVTPGATALTLMPSAPHSAAATWTNMDRAALDAQ